MTTTSEEPSLEQEFIRKLDEAIQKNLSDEHFGVEELSREISLSRSALLRKLKMVTHKSVSQYIREMRLGKAMEMLQKNVAPVSEVAYRTGFSSHAYFNTCFHEYYGFPPGEVKKMENMAHQSGLPPKEKQVQETEATDKTNRSVKWIVPVSAVILLLLALALFIYPGFLKNGPSTQSRVLKNSEKSIAVLPFKNLSEDKENEYFADGVMEDILTNLSYIKEFKLISRTSAEEFRNKTGNIHEISNKLGVNYVLEGSVQKYGEKVRVRVQFIDAKNDQHILSEVFDRDLSDIFIIQSEIAIKIAAELQSTLLKEEIEQIKKVPTKKMEAYRFYAIGRNLMRNSSKMNYLQSITNFEQALTIDPDYALAYAGVADSYFRLTVNSWYPRPDGWLKGKEFALKALNLDKNLSEAHAVLGILYCYGDWKWEEARKELSISIGLNKNNAMALQWYAQLLDIINDRAGARAYINMAYELDPFHAPKLGNNALFYYNEGKFDEALKVYDKIQNIFPDETGNNWIIFKIYLKKKDEPKALEAYRKWLTINEKFSSEEVNNVMEIYSREGMRGILKWNLEYYLKNYDQAFYRTAVFFALLDEKEKALDWLEKSMETKASAFPRINSDPEFDNLRSEPRFKAMIDKMGLTPYSK